jgi:hypothetical protein
VAGAGSEVTGKRQGGLLAERRGVGAASLPQDEDHA